MVTFYYLHEYTTCSSISPSYFIFRSTRKVRSSVPRFLLSRIQKRHKFTSCFSLPDPPIFTRILYYFSFSICFHLLWSLVLVLLPFSISLWCTRFAESVVASAFSLLLSSFVVVSTLLLLFLIENIVRCETENLKIEQKITDPISSDRHLPIMRIPSGGVFICTGCSGSSAPSLNQRCNYVNYISVCRFADPRI